MKRFILLIALSIGLLTNANAQGTSTTSDIVVNSGFTYNQDIDYANYTGSGLTPMTTSNSVAVGSFIIRDGGSSSPDSDNKNTRLDSVIFSVTNRNFIHSLGIFDGNTLVRQIWVGTSNVLGFGRLNLVAPDDGTKNFTLRAMYTTEVFDMQRNVFSITNVYAPSSSNFSQFGATNGGGATTSSSGMDNRLNVIATRLLFTTHPDTFTYMNAKQNIAPTATAQDANGNVDINYTGVVTLSTTNGLNIANNVETAVNGQAVFDEILFTEIGVTRLVTNNTSGLTNDTSAQVRVERAPKKLWDRGASTDSWHDSLNWYPEGVPTIYDSVVLDNTYVPGNYTVNISGARMAAAEFMAIRPVSGNEIRVEILSTNTRDTALYVKGAPGVNAVKIYAGGVIHNVATGSTNNTNSFIIGDGELAIYNGGRYSHQTLLPHRNLVDALSDEAGTELGSFEFDVPTGTGPYVLDITGVNFGSLVLRPTRAGGTRDYTTTDTSGIITVRGNLEMLIGVNFDPDVAAVRIGRHLINGGTFDPSATAWIVMNGTGTQNISGIGTYKMNKLEINKPSGHVELLVPIQLEDAVGTELRMTKGNIKTDAINLLTLLENAQTTGGSYQSFVDGPMSKTFASTDGITLPIGDDTFYRPVFIEPTSTNTTTFSAEYFSRIAPQPAYDTSKRDMTLKRVSGNEHWNITRTSGISSAYLTLHWASYSNIRPGYEDQIRVAWWDGTKWRNVGGNPIGGDAEQGSVTSDSLLAFGVFTLGSLTYLNEIPVELVAFTGEMAEKDVLLKWTTASEINNRGFDIMRSADGVNWHTIGFVDGMGNWQGLIDYTFLDRSVSDLQSNVAYYQLRQNDYNGDQYFSDIISVRLPHKQYAVEGSFYDGNANTVKMQVNAGQNGPLNITVTDMLGKTVYSTTKNVSHGHNNVEIPLPQVPQGIHILTVTGGDMQYSNKLYFRRN